MVLEPNLDELKLRKIVLELNLDDFKPPKNVKVAAAILETH